MAGSQIVAELADGAVAVGPGVGATTVRLVVAEFADVTRTIGEDEGAAPGALAVPPIAFVSRTIGVGELAGTVGQAVLDLTFEAGDRLALLVPLQDARAVGEAVIALARPRRCRCWARCRTGRCGTRSSGRRARRLRRCRKNGGGAGGAAGTDRSGTGRTLCAKAGIAIASNSNVTLNMTMIVADSAGRRSRLLSSAGRLFVGASARRSERRWSGRESLGSHITVYIA